MRHRALVVEDDPDIAESVTDTLESLGHAQEWARSQEEARKHIASGGFTYVLLDLQIPVRFGRGLACIECGEHLAREMRQSPTMQGVPIIVMTAYGKEGLEIAAPLCEYGVVDFINKPFPRTGRTLASVIRGVLERHARRREPASTKRRKPEQPFQGGELVFYTDRIELCGVTVVSNGKSAQMYVILDTLKQRLDAQRYKAFPGTALAEVVGGFGGQGSIAGSVRDFRRHVAELLGQELGLKVERDDVIETSNAGYRLNARIVVEDRRFAGSRPAHDGPATAGREPVNTGSRDPVNTGAASSDPVNSGSRDPVNQRGELILAELRKGNRLRAPALAERLGWSQSIVKRELEALKAQGRIMFVGASKTGYYQLAETASA